LAASLPPGGLTAATREVIERLARSPQRVPIQDKESGRAIEVVIGKEDVLDAIRYPVDGDNTRLNLEQWPRFILELHGGDYRYLAALALGDRRPGSGTDLMPLLVDQSLGISAARDARLRRAAQISPLEDVNLYYRLTRTLSPAWDVGDDFRSDFKISAPVLLLQGDVDFSTPLENAQHLRRFLANGHLLEVQGGGTHSITDDAIRLLPDVRAKVREFLAAPTNELPVKLRSMPAAVQLPALQFAVPGPRSLYDEWLAK